MNTEHATDSFKSNTSESSRLLRKLRTYFLYFLFVIIAFLGLGFLLGWIYEDAVKKYLITELNKQLNTPIIIDTKDIDFSIIKNFPYASLDFKNIKAKDAVESRDKQILFQAGKISLQFNLPDLFRKTYRIKKMEIDDVVLN